jgi:hypothetical protein
MDPPPSIPPSSPQPSLPRFTPLTPSPPKGGSGGEVTLTGQMEFLDIEGGCLVIRAGNQAYQVIGKDREALRPGTTVTVRGRIRTDVFTICQVGPVFEVTEVLPS